MKCQFELGRQTDSHGESKWDIYIFHMLFSKEVNKMVFLVNVLSFFFLFLFLCAISYLRFDSIASELTI
jgi:hypothetical protein